MKTVKKFSDRTIRRKKSETEKTSVLPKLKVSKPGDKSEREADTVADQVMRMPEEEEQPAISMKPEEEHEPAISMQPKEEEEPAGVQMNEEEETSNVQKKEEDKEVQTKPAQNSGAKKRHAPPEVTSQLQHSQSDGKPLPKKVNSELSDKMGSDFSDVKVHTGTNAVQMNKALKAKAFTHKNHIYFNQGQFAPENSAGKKLLVHELMHVVQQRQAPQVQRSPVNLSGRQFMEGEVILNNAAKRDILTYENLLTGEDQAHIAVTSNGKLAYEVDYTEPKDPFRWNILKDVIDNHYVKINGVESTEKFDTIDIRKSLQGRKTETVSISLFDLRASGITLATESTQLNINPISPHIIASSDNTYHEVYYETGKGGRGMIGSNALAHEFYGHLYLATQNVPFLHGQNIPESANIVDPLGRQFNGAVDDFIKNFASASHTSVIESPSLYVSPQYLKTCLEWIEQNGAAHISTEGLGSIDSDLDLKWQYLSNNYDILKTKGEGAKISEELVITATNVEDRIVSWVNGLPEDKKEAFRNVLNSIARGFLINRRSGLAMEIKKHID